MTITLTRRDFLHRAAIAIAVPRGVRPRVESRAPAPLRIGVVQPAAVDTAAAARAAGLQLGLDEAQRAASLFGGSIALVPVAASDLPKHALTAVIGGDGDDGCAALARAADAHQMLYFNVVSSSDTVRGAGCRATTFHVIPSDSMVRDALAQSPQPEEARVAAWDPSLVRFGADTLNERFRARFARGMTADAWTAWLAVKILWESSLRARSADAAAIRAYLRRDTTQFDGHKGRALSFRSWDQQLRQPVYVVTGGEGGGGEATRVLAEVPTAPNGDDSSREILDRIGARRADSPCKLAS